MRFVKIHDNLVTYVVGEDIITVPITPMAKRVLDYYNKQRAND